MLNEWIDCWSNSFHFVRVGILILLCTLPHGTWVGRRDFDTWTLMDMTLMTMLQCFTPRTPVQFITTCSKESPKFGIFVLI